MKLTGKRVVLIALIISLLIHGLLLTATKFSFPVNMDNETTVIEARLIPKPQPTTPALAPAPSVPKKHQPTAKPHPDRKSVV